MGTEHARKPKVTPEEQRALDTFVKLMRASESVHSAAVRPLAEHGLSPSQFAVLEALYHVGPMCLTSLARNILKTSGNLTMVVDNLEKRGLAVRQASENDRRFVRVTITDSGAALIKQIFPDHAALIAELMSALSAPEQEMLAKLCKKLGLGRETEEAT